MIIGVIVFMVFMALVLALWEIQIEGKDGWAAKAPCWRIDKSWLMKLTDGRPVTGYHFYMTLFIFSIIHLPFFFISWNLQKESLILGFYVGMVLLEDFLWFVLNPYYGVKNFCKDKIWWHKKWLGPVPVMYWLLLPVSAILIYLGWNAI